MWDMHDGMGWWMVWGSIFWTVFFVGLVVVIAWMAGGTRAGAGAADRPETAIEVLRKRYARGELTREEFERIRADLTDSA